MRRALLASLILYAPASPASAHTQWADGSPVPVWIKNQCCGVTDAHHLRPDQVRAVAGGYQILGDTHTKIAGMPPTEIKPGLIPYSKVTPSPDGEWWIFYGPENPEFLYCIFGPPPGV